MDNWQLHGFSFETYRQSRHYREWTKALTDYGIAWSDETTPHSSEIHLYLDDLDLNLLLVGPYQSPKSSSGTVITGEKWDEPTYWGDHLGRFGRLGSSVQSGNLHWCKTCSKVFLSQYTRTHCVLCHGEKTFLAEAHRLTWFGFHGTVEFRPVPIPKPGIEALSENNTQSTDLSIEEAKAMLGISKAPVVNDLFDERDAIQAAKREEGEWDKLKKALSGKARVHGWPSPSAIEKLASEYPNYSEVCDFVLAEIALAPYRKAERMRLPNILLVGGPSCGKSSFCRRMAEILAGDDWERVDLGQCPTHFEITGTDSGFSRSKEGRVLRLMASRNPGGPVLNPVLILDEIDKVSVTAQYSPLPALLSLLEKQDAERFRDAFLGFPVNASGIRYFATANDRYAIPAPLLSRFEVFCIADYSFDQFIDVVVPNIYNEWLQEFHEGTFPSVLPRSLRQTIAEDVGFVARRVLGAVIKVARDGTFGFRPDPTWESLKNSRGWE